MIVVELPGQPIGKGRPRFRVGRTKSGRSFVNAYTPAQTRVYEHDLGWMARAAMGGKKPLSGALRVIVRAFMDVPPSWPQKRRDAALAGAIRPTGKPDAENIGKTIDGLNGIVWLDDSQIVDIRIIKQYAEISRLVVEVEEIAPQLWEEAA